MDSEQGDQTNNSCDSLVKALSQSPPGSSEAYATIESLAKASKDASLRQSLGQNGVLSRIISELNDFVEADGALDPSSVQRADSALRCIGNACIDNDNARQIVIAHHPTFSWAKQCLHPNKDLDLQRLTAKVLYNICMDHEESQKACYDEKIYISIQRLIATIGAIHLDDDVPLLLELLFWISSQKPGDGVEVPLTGDQLEDLLLIPSVLSMQTAPEDFASAVESCLCFLRDPKVQRLVNETGRFMAVWDLLVQNELRIRTGQRILLRETSCLPDTSSKQNDNSLNEEDVKLLVPLSTSLIWILSDASAMPNFILDPSHQLILSTAIRDLDILKDGPGRESCERIASTACQIYGNHLFLKPLGVGDVAEKDLHRLLLKGIVNTASAELMFSACGLLVHLSRPSVEAREEIMKDDNAFAAVEKLCFNDNPQLKQSGVRLLRALGKESQANQALFASLAEDVMTELKSAANADKEAEETQ